jgi:hypothetical protein
MEQMASKSGFIAARIVRVAVKAILFVVVMVVVTCALLYFIFFRDARLKPRLENEISHVLGLPVSIGTVETMWPGAPVLHLHSLRIDSSNGKALLEANDAWVILNITSLLRRIVKVTGIKLKGGTIFLTRYADGSWNVTPLWPRAPDSQQLTATEIRLEDSRLEIEDDTRARHTVPSLGIKLLHLSPSLSGKPNLTISGNIGNGSFQVDGTLAPSLLAANASSADDSKFELDISEFDLSQLNSLLTPDAGPAGTLTGSIDARLKLTLRKPFHFKGSGFITLTDATWTGPRPSAQHDAPVTEVSGRLGFRVSGDLEELRFRALYGELNGVEAQTHGTLSGWRTSTPDVDFHVETEDFDLKEAIASIEDWLPAALRTQTDWLGGDVRFTGDIRGTFPRLQAYGNLDLVDVYYTPPQPELRWAEARGRLSIAPGSVRIHSITAKHVLGQAQVAGQVVGSAMDLSAHFAQADLSKLRPWLLAQPYWSVPPELSRIQNLQGNSEIDVKLQGNLTRLQPTASIRLKKAQLNYEGLGIPLRDLDGRLNYEPGTLKVTDLQGLLDRSRISVQGVFSLKDETLVAEALQISSPNFTFDLLPKLASFAPLSGLFHSELYNRVRDLSGAARVDLDYKNNVLRLSTRLDNVGFRLSDAATQFSGIAGRLRLENGTVYMEEISGNAGYSSFKVSGRASGPDFESGVYNVAVESRLVFPEAQALLPPWSGWSKLAIVGPVPVQVRLDGSLRDGLAAKGMFVLNEGTDFGFGSLFHKGPFQVAKVAFDAALSNRLITLSDAAVDLDGMPLKVTGQIWDFAGPAGRMDLYVKSPQRYRFDALAALFEPLSRLGARGEVGVDLHVSGPLQKPNVAGDLSLSGVSIPLSGVEIAGATGALHFSNGDIRSDNLALIIGGTPTTVSAKLHHGSPLSGSIRFDRLNLDALVPAILNRASAAGGWQDLLKRQPFSLNLSVGSLQYKQVPLDHVSTQVSTDDAGLHFHDVAFGALGGRLNGDVNLKPASEEFSLNVALSGVPVERLSSEILHRPPALSGNLSVRASLTGRGFKWDTLSRTLRGSGHFEVFNGKLEQANLPQRILTMAVMLHEGPFGFNFYRVFQTIDPPEFKWFHTWNGDFTVETGAVQLKESVFTSDVLDLVTSGRILLENGKLEGEATGRMPEVSPGLGHVGRFLSHMSVRGFTRGLKSIVTGHFPWRESHEHAHRFAFTLKGDAVGPKSIDHFRFLDAWYNIW